VKVGQKKPKVRRKAIRDFWGNVIGYRKIRKTKRKKKQTRRRGRTKGEKRKR